jgi:hypothetical protein
MELDKVINLVRKMTDKVTNQIIIMTLIDRMLITKLEQYVKNGDITVEELNKRLLE